MIPYPLLLTHPARFIATKDPQQLRYLFYISQFGSWVPINGQPYKLSIQSDQGKRLHAKLIDELKHATYSGIEKDERKNKGGVNWVINQFKAVFKSNESATCVLTLRDYNYDAHLDAKIQAQQTARDLAYKNAVKHVLFLAMCSGDSDHLSVLLKDPYTLSVAKENGGDWLLDQVIQCKFSVDPFDGVIPNPEAVLAVLSLHRVRATDRDQKSIRYLETFESRRPTVFEYHQASQAPSTGLVRPSLPSDLVQAKERQAQVCRAKL